MELTPILHRLWSAPVIVAGGHLSLELSNNFLPIVYPLFIKKLGLTYAQIGTVALVAVAAGSVSQPIFGYLADRFDQRWLALLSIIWIAVTMAAVGLVPAYWLLLLVVALGGLGSAAFHPAGAALASAVASERRGGVMALFSVGGNLGSALSPLLVGLGLAWFGLPGTLLLLPVVALLSLWLFFGLQRVPNPRVVGQERTIATGPWLALLLVILMASSRSWFFGSLSTYLPEWLQSQGWSPESAGSMLSVSVAAMAVGSLSGGLLSDRVGRGTVMLVALGGMAPALLLLLSGGVLWQVVAIVLAGILVGATFPIVIVMAQVAWPHALGLASALAIGVGWLPAGIGSWTVGAIADRASLTAALHTLLLAPLFGLAAVVAFQLLYGSEDK